MVVGPSSYTEVSFGELIQGSSVKLVFVVLALDNVPIVVDKFYVDYFGSLIGSGGVNLIA